MALGRILKDIREKTKDDELKVTREILWTSQNGKWVVVAGPFPHGFSRTLTAKTVDGAVMRRTSADFEEGIMIRGATTNSHPAKTLARLVIPLTNDWGEVCP